MTTDQIEPVTEEVPTTEAEVEVAAPRDRRALRRGRRRAALVLALLVALSGLGAWWLASNDEQITRAERRDQVLIEARQAIATMNTLDHRSVDEGIESWTSVTAGRLHDQLAGVTKEDRELLADQGKISTGRVIDAAVVDLDTTSATVVAAVEVTVRDGKDPDAEPTVKRNRFTADLVRERGAWKLESLEQVAVSLS